MKVPSTNIEFSPGVYIITGSNDSAAAIISTFDQRVRDEPYVKGIVVKQRWGYGTGNSPAMEGNQGEYNFTHLRTVRDHVRQYAGKFVSFWPSYKLFTATGAETPAIVPAYLRTTAYNGGAYMNDGTSTGRIWRPDVCDEFDRVLRDFGEEFGDDPTINSIMGAETAPGPSATSESDWPADPGYTSRHVQLGKAAAEGFPLAVSIVNPNFTVDRQSLNDQTKVAPWYCGVGCADSIPFKTSLVPVHDLIRANAGGVVTAPHIEFGNTGQAVQYATDYPLYPQYPGSHIPDVYECLFYCTYSLEGNYIFLQLSQANGQTAASMIAAVNQLGAAGLLPVSPLDWLTSGFIAGQVRETTTGAGVDLNDGQKTEVEFVNKFVDNAPPSTPTVELAVSGRYFVEVTTP